MDKKALVIEKGVPAPKKRQTHAWPLESMEVGDSFVVPNKHRISVQAAISTFKKNTGAVFTCRKIDDDSCRVWRLK